jgi:hypothetical protein
MRHASHRVVAFAFAAGLACSAQARQSPVVESIVPPSRTTESVGQAIAVDGTKVFLLSTPGVEALGQAFAAVPSCPAADGSCATAGKVFNNTNQVSVGGLPADYYVGVGWELRAGYLMARGWRPLVRTIRSLHVAPGSETITEIDGDVHRVYYVAGSAPRIYVALFTNEADFTIDEDVQPVQVPMGYYVEITKDGQGRIVASTPQSYSGVEARCQFVSNVREADRSRLVRQIDSDKQINTIPNQNQPLCP